MASAEYKKSGKKQPMPGAIAPMLCTLTREPIDDPDYLYEIKWDGYRIISYVKKGNVRMDSRSAKDYTHRYPVVADALLRLGHEAVVDGEVVVFGQFGLPDFDALQLYNGHNTAISYCLFDLLWLDGYSLLDLPLVTRKDLLQDLIKNDPVFRFSASFDNGPILYQEMLNRNLEGIVAKRKDSAYHPGERASDWLKTPTRKRQEFVIGGWAESDKSRSLKSLLFGAYNKGKLEWIGRSGGGYKEKEMPAILRQLQALEIDHSPFVNKVLDTKGAATHWVRPKLVANFEFATWTKSGRIRKPATFLGFRKDKKAGQVVREIPREMEDVEEEKKKVPTKEKKAKTSTTGSNWPIVEKQTIGRRDDLSIGDCTVAVSDIEREIWPGIPKARLLEYYHQVAPYILPYLKDRPESLHLKLENATAPGLYIKDMEGRQPDCAELYTDTRRHPGKGKRDRIDYLVCNNEATLLWMINLGCVDVNPWNSRRETPEQPDYIVIDLDPTVKDAKQDFLGKLIDTALATKAYCERRKLHAFAKTSGKTGLHFYLPCTGLSHRQARAIAEVICRAVADAAPESATVASSINSRGSKIYVDPSQNDYADTVAAPYSVRPYAIPTVSTPLEWKEINPRLAPSVFTFEKTLDRIKKKGDLFQGVLDRKIARANTALLSKIARATE